MQRLHTACIAIRRPVSESWLVGPTAPCRKQLCIVCCRMKLWKTPTPQRDKSINIRFSTAPNLHLTRRMHIIKSTAIKRILII